MADEEINYEQQRLNNIARNRELLLSLGLEDLRIPDAPPKSSKSKSKGKSASKSKSKPTPRAKRKASDDGDDADEDMTAVDGDGSSVGGTTPRTPKRPKLGNGAGSDFAESGGARRSSRNVRRVSYARDGAIAAIRSPSPAAASSDDYSEGDDEDKSDAEEESEDEDEDGEPRKSKSKANKGGVSHGGKKAHHMRPGRVDHTKLRNVAPMGTRKNDPYVSSLSYCCIT